MSNETPREPVAGAASGYAPEVLSSALWLCEAGCGDLPEDELEKNRQAVWGALSSAEKLQQGMPDNAAGYILARAYRAQVHNDKVSGRGEETK